MKGSGLYPFGYLPLLELPDGTRINETFACPMAVGIRADKLGSTEAAQYTSARLACKCHEVLSELLQQHSTIKNVDTWNAEKRAALDKWTSESQAGYVAKFEALCNEDGTCTANGDTI